MALESVLTVVSICIEDFEESIVESPVCANEIEYRIGDRANIGRSIDNLAIPGGLILKLSTTQDNRMRFKVNPRFCGLYC